MIDHGDRILSRDDAIAPAEDCLEVVEKLAGRGVPVETVIFDGVTHGFDQQHRAALSALEYDARATEEALDRAAAFLQSSLGAARAAE